MGPFIIPPVPVPPSSGMIHLTDKEFTTLVSFVKQKYGINLQQKRVLIEGRMTNMLRERGLTNFQQYLDILFKDSSGKEVTTLLNKLTTNLSYFMREPDHYQYLRDSILPQLVRTHGHNRDLRIWSAGCSAGQEAYTTAMVLDEFFGPQKHLWDTRILASDISMRVLEKAKQGIYPADDIRDIPPAWRNKYFKLLPNGQYQVCEKIRNEVIFRSINLVDAFSFRKPFDVIFCRNVMIYFDGPTKERLVEKFYQVLGEGGYFFIGHSESINRDHTRFRYIKPAIYQKGGRA